MDDLDLLRQDLKTKRPEAWSELPDLGLYMDQVIYYLSRSQLTPESSQKLTPAMVNNYVKEGLLPRANQKRYDREHLAMLQAVVWLKEVLTVRETGELTRHFVGTEPVAAKYGEMLGLLDQALNRVLKGLDASDGQDLAHKAMAFALAGYANKLVCQRILEMLEGRESEKEATK